MIDETDYHDIEPVGQIVSKPCAPPTGNLTPNWRGVVPLKDGGRWEYFDANDGYGTEYCKQVNPDGTEQWTEHYYSG